MGNNRYRNVIVKLGLLFSAACVLAAAATPAVATKRVALVIGNSSYVNVPLKNPKNDATDIGAALKRLAFDVDVQTDVDKRQMLKAICSFADKLKRADIGFFFYAGHGIQVGGANYLIPVGTNVKSAADVEFEGVHAGRILSKMEEAGNSLNVVVLDACRNNPFRGLFRSTEQGLAQMHAPVGSIIAYATSPGSVAHDGKGRNGIFTKHLLKALPQQELTVRDVFDQAGLAVMDDTERAQVPWVHSSPMEPIYLAGGNPEEVPRVSDPPKKYNSKPDTGSLKVTSQPGRAQIILDGELLGKTPRTIGNIPVGRHWLGVQKKGYLTEELWVEIKKDEKSLAYFDLEKERFTGRLTVQSYPRKAMVRILNIKPRYRPGMDLVPGKYQIEVSARGFVKDKRWVELGAGEDLRVDVSLRKHNNSVMVDPYSGVQFRLVD